MKKNKKGTDVGASMPNAEKGVLHVSNQVHSNTASNISLILFSIFVILFITGAYVGNDLLTFFGLGIGVAASFLMLGRNLKE